MDQEEKQDDSQSTAPSELKGDLGAEASQGKSKPLELNLTDYLPNYKSEDVRESPRRLYEMWSEDTKQEMDRLREESEGLRERNKYLERERAKLAERDRKQTATIVALDGRLQEADNRLLDLESLKRTEVLYQNLKETLHERHGYMFVGSILTGLGTSAVGGLLIYSGGTISTEGCIASTLMLAAGVAIFGCTYLHRSR